MCPVILGLGLGRGVLNKKNVVFRSLISWIDKDLYTAVSDILLFFLHLEKKENVVKKMGFLEKFFLRKSHLILIFIKQ